MERVSFVTHRDVRVLEVDYSGIDEVKDLMQVAGRATRVLEREPPQSALVLVNLSGTRYSLRLARNLGELAIANAPFVRARALVGLPAFLRPVVREVARFSGRPTEMFDEREPALEWLVERAA